MVKKDVKKKKIKASEVILHRVDVVANSLEDVKGEINAVFLNVVGIREDNKELYGGMILRHKDIDNRMCALYRAFVALLVILVGFLMWFIYNGCKGY